MSTARVYDEAPKLEIEWGYAGSRGSPPQASPSSSSAEMSRIEARITAKLIARFQAHIATEMARIAKHQTNNRSQSQTNPPPPLSTAPEEEGSPLLSRVWQGILFVFSLSAPSCQVVYALTGQSWYCGMGAALVSLTASCLILILFSSPANKRIEKALALYGSLWFLSYLGGDAFGNIVTDKQGTADTGWLCVLGLPVAFALVFYFMLMRRKIGAFPRRRLQDYISNTVFLQGTLGCLPPILYLTSQSIKCLGKNYDYEGDIFKVCGGVLTPTLSITTMLVFFLCARVIFVPLTKTKVTPFQLASFKGLSFKLRLQMVLLCVVGFGNVVLFGILGDGPLTDLIFWLWFVCTLAILVLGFSEVVSIAFRAKTGESGDASSGSDQGTLEMLDRMHMASPGGADLV